MNIVWFIDQAGGTAAALQALLTEKTMQGWQVHTILTNGINAWTVIFSKEA